MPAVDLARLTREVDRLTQAFGVPADLLRATLDVLEFYAERARRPMASGATLERGRSLDVPAPVVRAIGAGLQKQARLHPEGCLPVADVLWEARTRETQVLACWILAVRTDAEVADWLERRVADMDDPGVLRAAVDRALQGWRQAEAKAYIDQIDRWLGSPRSALQALGLRALESALDLPELEDLQRAYRGLSLLPRPVRGEARHALAAVLAGLAQRSPAETTRFLIEEIERDVPGIDRLVRSLAAALPLPQRDRLAAALAARAANKGPA
jgi:hypothetical protein